MPLAQPAPLGPMDALPSSTSRSAPQQPPSSSSGGHNTIKNLASIGFKNSLKALKKTAQAVPPLGAAELVPEATRQRKEYEQFESNIIIAAQGLEKHITELGPGQLSDSVISVAQELKRYAEYAKEREQRGRLQQYADLNHDADDVMECYRRIQALFQQLQSNVALSVWRVTNETLRLAHENFSVANENLTNARLNGLNPVHQARYNSSAASQLRRRGCTANTRELTS